MSSDGNIITNNIIIYEYMAMYLNILLTVIVLYVNLIGECLTDSVETASAQSKKPHDPRIHVYNDSHADIKCYQCIYIKDSFQRRRCHDFCRRVENAEPQKRATFRKKIWLDTTAPKQPSQCEKCKLIWNTKYREICSKKYCETSENQMRNEPKNEPKDKTKDESKDEPKDEPEDVPKDEPKENEEVTARRFIMTEEDLRTNTIQDLNVSHGGRRRSYIACDECYQMKDLASKFYCYKNCKWFHDYDYDSNNDGADNKKKRRKVRSVSDEAHVSKSHISCSKCQEAPNSELCYVNCDHVSKDTQFPHIHTLIIY